jgi:predicted transcriptional regulator
MIEKLESFKKKVSGKRMAKMWDAHDKLLVGVATSLLHAKSEYDRPGWIRGTDINTRTSSDVTVNAKKDLNFDIEGLRKVDLMYRVTSKNLQTGYTTTGTIRGTLDKFFESFSINVHGIISFREIGKIIAEITTEIANIPPPYRIHFPETQIARIVSQMIALGLLEPCEQDEKQFQLTKKGSKIRNELVVQKS